MNYVIFDLEATCWENEDKGTKQQEIIEIGAVLFNETGQELADLEQFVRPTENPVLSEFCVSLTSIQQKQVDDAPEFTGAVEVFRQWIGSDDSFLLCSWGDWDKFQLKNEARRKGLELPWLDQHVNLKQEYTRLKVLKKAPGMKAALKREGIPLAGTHHRGIDDARNIGVLFARYFHIWRFVGDRSCSPHLIRIPIRSIYLFKLRGFVSYSHIAGTWRGMPLSFLR